MATRSLSPNQVTQRLLKHRHAVMVLAMQRARKSVKNSLRAQGFKVSDYTAAEITTLARTYLAQHREWLVADTKQIIATSPLFERWRWSVANITTAPQTQEPLKSITSAVQMSGAK